MDKKQLVLSEIRRLAKEANGRAPGAAVFKRQTGLSSTLWEGKHWPNWSAALREAGFEPNKLIAAIPDNDLLRALALLARQLGRFPSARDVKFASANSTNFPSHNVFSRLGARAEQQRRLREWCQSTIEFNDLVPLLEGETPSSPGTTPDATPAVLPAPVSTIDFDSIIPPVVACLRDLAAHSKPFLAELERRGLKDDLEFERRTGMAFRLLGLDVQQLGQGTGRQADGIATCPEEHWALVYDAKLRTGQYRIGTEDRKFREYIERSHAKLQQAGFTKTYFGIISGSFSESDLNKAHEVVRLTGAKSCVLLTVDAILALVEFRLRHPRKANFAWLERFFMSTRIVGRESVDRPG